MTRKRSRHSVRSSPLTSRDPGTGTHSLPGNGTGTSRPLTPFRGRRRELSALPCAHIRVDAALGFSRCEVRSLYGHELSPLTPSSPLPPLLTLDRRTERGGYLLTDLYSDDCSPCRLSPTLIRLFPPPLPVSLSATHAHCTAMCLCIDEQTA